MATARYVDILTGESLSESRAVARAAEYEVAYLEATERFEYHMSRWQETDSQWHFSRMQGARDRMETFAAGYEALEVQLTEEEEEEEELSDWEEELEGFIDYDDDDTLLELEVELGYDYGETD